MPPDWSDETPAPIVPVSPTAVTEKPPPSGGAPFETVIEVILLAFAEITSMTLEKPSVLAQTWVEPDWPGLPFHTSTVQPCAEAVELEAVRYA